MTTRRGFIALSVLALLTVVEAQELHPGRIACGTTAPKQSICDNLRPPQSRRSMRLPLDSECVQDTNSGLHFCGFQGARCMEDSQCDFGRCSTANVGEEGICLGGLGDSCEGPEGPDDSLCLGNLGCSGRDSARGTGSAVCGGTGAECLYTSRYIPGDTPNHLACVSGHCNANTLTCAGRPTFNPSRNRVDLKPPQPLTKEKVNKQQKKKKANKQAEQQRLQQERAAALEQQRLQAQAQAQAQQPAYDEDEGAAFEDFEDADAQEDAGVTMLDVEGDNVDIIAPSGSNCPRGFSLCPIANSGRYDFGCFNTRTSVNMCGGCAGVPEAWSGKVGVDCLSMPGVVSSACVDSECRVFSCSSKYELDHRTGTCKPKYY